MSGRERENQKTVQLAICFAAFGQAEEGQYVNRFQLQSLQIFPDSISASLILPGRVCIGPRPFSKHQSADAKQSNFNSCPYHKTHCFSKMKLEQASASWTLHRKTSVYVLYSYLL